MDKEQEKGILATIDTKYFFSIFTIDKEKVFDFLASYQSSSSAILPGQTLDSTLHWLAVVFFPSGHINILFWAGQDSLENIYNQKIVYVELNKYKLVD